MGWYVGFEGVFKSLKTFCTPRRQGEGEGYGDGPGHDCTVIVSSVGTEGRKYFSTYI